jgi:DNA adenine methylase
MKSPLYWAGKKTDLIPNIQALWNNHKDLVYVDLFAGSLEIPLSLQPEKAIINDLNSDLISFWEWVQVNGIAKNFEYANEEYLFYIWRDYFNIEDRKPELFYYLIKTCHRGLCRYNNDGIFNSPYGHRKNLKYVTDFSEYKEIIKNWEFTAKSYSSIKLESNYFVYCDPPYDESFTKYTSNGFTWEDQIELAVTMYHNPGISVISNKATDRIIDLYNQFGFDIQYVDMPRKMGNKSRDSVREIIATKGLENVR